MVMRLALSIFFLFLCSVTQAQDLSSDWEVEAESPASHLSFFTDSIEIFTPAGLTLWRKQPFRAPFMLEYEAMVVVKDSTDRLSDLNCFFLATDPSVSGGSVLERIDERGGVFANCSQMQLYYVGYGGNWNTTTRFRRYNGKPNPPLLQEYTDSAHLLQPNQWYHIRIEANGSRVRYYINEELLFDYTDLQPLQFGWFGFRTTWSHCLIRDFSLKPLDEK